MASNPMLQAVLRFQNQQTTAPQEPIEEPEPFPAALPQFPDFLEPDAEEYQPGAPDDHRRAGQEEGKQDGDREVAATKEKP